jgi:hypothetical protein
MLCAFVDESERNKEFYFLGALIGTEEQVQALSDDMDKILLKHSSTFPSLSLTTEFHAHEMMAGSEDWRRIPLRMRFGIYDEALEAISNSGAAIYIEGIDVEAQIARGYKTVTPAREVAFSYILERINEYAQRRRTTAIIVADDHHTAAESRSNFTRYQQWGTFGYRSSRLQSISDNVEFIDSKMSRALQAADLATYLYNRRKTHNEANQKAHEQKVLMWRKLSPAVNRGRARIWP